MGHGLAMQRAERTVAQQSVVWVVLSVNRTMSHGKHPWERPLVWSSGCAAAAAAAAAAAVVDLLEFL